MKPSLSRKFKNKPKRIANYSGVRNLMPDMVRTVLTYNSGAYLQKVTGHYNDAQTFRANSIYDPDYSNATKNTKGSAMDFLTTMYVSYRVYRARFTFTLFNESGIPARVVLVPRTYTVGIPSTSMYASNLAQRPFAKTVILGPVNSPTAVQTLSIDLDIKKIYAHDSDEAFASTNYASAMNNNPTAAAYLDVHSGQIDDLESNTVNIRYAVRAIYDVQLNDLVDTLTDAV